ncbi:MAG TPA: hypothetical protein VES89_07895 [Candidatus Competibacteraceae bacterium]|nr:hypothetical protein [Candidatus Competibacteraceae bacterium]
MGQCVSLAQRRAPFAMAGEWGRGETLDWEMAAALRPWLIDWGLDRREIRSAQG